MKKGYSSTGIKNRAKAWFNHPEIDSLKVNEDNNFNKPLSEVSEEIQRRKNPLKVPGNW